MGGGAYGGFGFTKGAEENTQNQRQNTNNGISAEAKAVMENLPKNPSKLLDGGWQETTHPKMAERTASRTFHDPVTNLDVRFDKGDPAQNGFAAKDHYHVENPNRTGKMDFYLDVDGNPVPKGSKESHIFPNGG